MKKIYLVGLLLVVALAACGKHDDPAPAALPAPAASAPAPTSTSSVALPMAQTTSDCGQPGFNSNSAMCDQAAEQHAPTSIPQSTVSTTPSDPVSSINDQLAKLGSLSVSEVNREGYPIFEMECNAQGQCVNGVGIPMGSISDVAKQMTMVRQSDIVKYGWKCKQFCTDGEGNIIGRPE
jgi:hypothetical protein